MLSCNNVIYNRGFQQVGYDLEWMNTIDLNHQVSIEEVFWLRTNLVSDNNCGAVNVRDILCKSMRCKTSWEPLKKS